MTAARGFYSPQLIIFASGPKHFKTGVIIKLAVEYARDGYNVYYADGENGKKSIRRRAKQSIMECTADELRDAPDLDTTLENFHRYMGATVTDVENRLAQIKATKGWEPDIIVWDSIDHFLPSKPEDQKKETRIQIQRVYHEVIALNHKLTTFSIAPSQVNKAAVSKKVFDMKDLAEDFGKVMNAHGVFAICATEDELEQGLRRIIVIAQREGERYTGHNVCLVKIDEARGIVDEVDKDAYYEEVEDV
jgi:KaiC/GvpD/RAD55 family RecA-like ATPase